VFDGPETSPGGGVELTVRYQLNGDDGLECMRVHNPTFQTNAVVSILASVAIIVLGLVWLALSGDHAGPWISIGIGAALLAASTMHRAYLTRRLRRTWNQLEETELTVREAGFMIIERGAQSEVAWSRFVRFREAPHHFLLYRSSDLYGIVPKRGFASAADLDAFRDLATKGIARV
jgi:hypothetical protein